MKANVRKRDVVARKFARYNAETPATTLYLLTFGYLLSKRGDRLKPLLVCVGNKRRRYQSNIFRWYLRRRRRHLHPYFRPVVNFLMKFIRSAYQIIWNIIGGGRATYTDYNAVCVLAKSFLFPLQISNPILQFLKDSAISPNVNYRADINDGGF